VRYFPEMVHPISWLPSFSSESADAKSPPNLSIERAHGHFSTSVK
jgi:hypothetical protein